ncbi:fructose-1,6-bisphosphatase, class II [Anaeromyxobacter dehalogenans 2CP-1]|uniref:Fructose-1,6-bisphosphatase n=1 Tax=Anaeromyxobacter dehalogenans (strain ATCC BAA-258 / DSM 21875 / 2CP-1) TaxID=455488 RepID=B8JAC7_ANAD2|nr:class II fructose-bisphosphatase [Anaeromyxobacter dehalogenans]ACL65646.1 fructose-1,6-bisphosphatase, class II [Anaeromyxobacter dehalogenans 2CP-1]
MDRNLALEVVRVTEAAALASARLMGRGDRNGADQAAVEAMRKAFNDIAIRGEVVIGEGERDEAPMLYIGEKVGRCRDGDAEMEIAVDPLEGTNLCATGAPNALSVIAMGEKGRLLRAPDTYMEKIAVGPRARGAVDLRRTPTENLRRVADALGKYVEDLTVVILDRPRHAKLVREVREAGARIKLIGDGDVAGALNTCFPDTGVDLLMGVGGAPEGVIAAAALRCVGGDLQGRLVFRNDAERERARGYGVKDLDRIMGAEELAGGNVMFAATGVTHGDFLKGVRFTGDGARTHSVVMRSRTGTLRYIETEHHFTRSPDYGW